MRGGESSGRSERRRDGAGRDEARARHEEALRRYGYPGSGYGSRDSASSSRRHRHLHASGGHSSRRSRTPPPYLSRSNCRDREGRGGGGAEGPYSRDRRRSREREGDPLYDSRRRGSPRGDRRDRAYPYRRERRHSCEPDRRGGRRRFDEERGDSARQLEDPRANLHAGSGAEEAQERSVLSEAHRAQNDADAGVVCLSSSGAASSPPIALTFSSASASPLHSASLASASPLVLRPRHDGAGAPVSGPSSPALFASSAGAEGGEAPGPAPAVVHLSPPAAGPQVFAGPGRGESVAPGEALRGPHDEALPPPRNGGGDGNLHRPHILVPGHPGPPGQPGAPLHAFAGQVRIAPPASSSASFPGPRLGGAPSPHAAFAPTPHNDRRPFFGSLPPLAGPAPHGAPPPPGTLPGGPGRPAGLCRLPPFQPPPPSSFPPLSSFPPPPGVAPLPAEGDGTMFCNGAVFGPRGPRPAPPSGVPPPPFFGPGDRPGAPPQHSGLGGGGPPRPPVHPDMVRPPQWAPGRGEEGGAATGPMLLDGRRVRGAGRQYEGDLSATPWAEEGGPELGGLKAGAAPVVLRLASVPQPLLTHENMLSFCSMFGRVEHVEIQPGDLSARVTFSDPAAAAEAGRSAPGAFEAPTLVVEVISQLHGSLVPPAAPLASAQPARGPAAREVALNAVVMHAPGPNKFVSAEYLEKKRQMEELQRRKEECAKKKQELLGKLTASLQLSRRGPGLRRLQGALPSLLASVFLSAQNAIARLTDPLTPESEQGAVRTMIASIKEKIAFLSYQKEGRPEEETRLEEKLRKLQAEALARGLNPRLVLQQAAAQNPYKLDFRTTYIKCLGPALEDIRNSDAFTEWVVSHAEPLMGDAIEAVVEMEEGGRRFGCLKYINRQSAEQVMRNCASLPFQLEWMEPPADPDADARGASSGFAAASAVPFLPSLHGGEDDGFVADGRNALLLESDLNTLRREEEGRGEEARGAVFSFNGGSAQRARPGAPSREGTKGFDQQPHNPHETEVDYDFE
ncbi:hypothetical protein BESB_013470 [Besnoitia besnoiti]|uniref:RRM domain-containing protein n=1 Tax=Besnoitia besnoiti TaxID=94643 RepID=A0A2A9M445_BESBE|nr:hypothetical protein BESB_013470 [Besnoitia besnoiti]PFH32735.1 hypothetical protein BESB_013470 [Besnoitia besnoiti]